MRLGSTLTLVLALALGGSAAFLARSYLMSVSSVGPAPLPAHTIVVATQPLPFGTQLTPENTTEIDWPSETRLEGSFATRDELLRGERRVVLSSIARNEVVLAGKITGPGQRATLSTLIEEGMRAVAVRVDDVRGVAGFILPNDRVDVVLTRDEEARESKGFADILLQNVKVLAIDQLANDHADKPTVARAVTLELNPVQAQKIILAQGVGRLSLILNKAGNATSDTPSRVTVADLGRPEIAGPKDDAKERIARLEARIEELKRSRAQQDLPVLTAQPAPIVRDATRTVNVVRDGVRREQYSVVIESR
ncbi:Flp pilus assembly protein CpaB [Methylobacterium nodulans]|uniref:Flp pilus assembly protein CpaB n=1 Tax=Methylobacterium nodulans (strain LMG 21967 / CNCM I-2342 / ORS 2060) TaxID=460265 RepID=B8IDY4_METNO|nr:Flp pilus assembly protein CpaB [Methylobacterium nodulans]ACL57530.1 Flp pilus assembly protein CpaB [Methylobacterium nodulans ORS 2060]